MIERYTLPAMGRVWSDENKFYIWLKIELYVCEALVKSGRIPKKSYLEILEKIPKKIDIIRISKIEEKTKHDVIAFITFLEEYIGPLSRYIHIGLTSSDLLDTTLSLQLQESTKIILPKLKTLAGLLKEKAKNHRKTVMIGRTHGIHAEPTTLGLKFALWLKEIERNIDRIKQANEIVRVGKISGAVGTYSNIDPFVEQYVCKKLKINSSPVSTQIIQRDRHAEYLNSLAVLASSLEKFAVEIRHLQRSEVLELEEPFEKGQKGSSAMPHKRNPVLSERICGLSRIVRANSSVALENNVLWHERDISHSSAERIIIPDSCILIDYMLEIMCYIIKGLQVYPENMKRNLNSLKGLIFSQKVLLALMKKGLSRENSYVLVQRNAMKCWKTGRGFKELLNKDKEAKKYLSSKEISKIFNLQSYLKNVPVIFKRMGL